MAVFLSTVQRSAESRIQFCVVKRFVNHTHLSAAPTTIESIMRRELKGILVFTDHWHRFIRFNLPPKLKTKNQNILFEWIRSGLECIFEMVIFCIQSFCHSDKMEFLLFYLLGCHKRCKHTCFLSNLTTFYSIEEKKIEICLAISRTVCLVAEFGGIAKR